MKSLASQWIGIAIIVWAVACSGGKPAPQTSPTGSGASGATGSGSGEMSMPASTGQICGTRGAATCPADQFCNYEPADQCGATDKPGHCTAKPAACPRIAAPVCGCDGKTYGNGCEASAAGVGVKQNGACG